MKKHAFLLSVLMLVSQAAYAEEKSELGLFFDKLRSRIEQLVPHKKVVTTTAVGGVRGAPVETNDVYWKGEARAIDSTELAAFQKAMALADDGKKKEAASAFAEFAKTYPDSPLRKDADQAVLLLQ